MAERRILTPLEVGTTRIRGHQNDVLIATDYAYIRLLTDPIYDQEQDQWTCLANVNDALCVVSVLPVAKEESWQ